MDTKQLFRDLVESDELKDISIKYIVRVAVVVLKLIQDNKYVFRIGD